MVTFKQCFKLWLFPALSYVILAAEIPLILVCVAYGNYRQNSLAAFGIALSVLLVINSPGLAIVTTIVKMRKAEVSFTVLQRFAFVIGLSLSSLLVLFLITPLSTWFFHTILILSDTQIKLVKIGLWIFAPAPIIVTYRRFYQGLLIHIGKTQFSFFAAAFRILTSVNLALLLMYLTHLPGIIIGTFALTLAALLEIIVLQQLSKPLRSEIEQYKKIVSFIYLFRFHLPMVTKNLLQLSCSFFITIGLTHFFDSALSLMIWPVVYGLLMLLDYPLQDIEPITVALFNQPQGPRTILHFSIFIGSMLSIVLIIYSVSPLAWLCFSKCYNFPTDSLPVAVHALSIAFTVPLFSAIRAWLRGILFTYEQFWAIQLSAFCAVLALVSVFIIAHSLNTTLAAIYLGIIAFSVSYFTEATVLALILIAHHRFSNTRANNYYTTDYN